MCGGGDSGPATIKDTAAQKKLAEHAAKRFNLYLMTIFEKKLLHLRK